MNAARTAALLRLALAGPLVALAACDAATDTGGGGDFAGAWEGSLRYELDTLFVDQNLRITADYTTRYRFDLQQDEELVWGDLTEYRTGTYHLREAGRRDTTYTWEDEPVLSFPVYGTYERPTLELDSPEAEEAQIFPANLWTFNVVGGTARMEDVFIEHIYHHVVHEGGDVEFEYALAPDEHFEMRRVD